MTVNTDQKTAIYAGLWTTPSIIYHNLNKSHSLLQYIRKASLNEYYIHSLLTKIRLGEKMASTSVWAWGITFYMCKRKLGNMVIYMLHLKSCYYMHIHNVIVETSMTGINRFLSYPCYFGFHSLWFTFDNSPPISHSKAFSFFWSWGIFNSYSFVSFITAGIERRWFKLFWF